MRNLTIYLSTILKLVVIAAADRADFRNECHGYLSRFGIPLTQISKADMPFRKLLDSRLAEKIKYIRNVGTVAVETGDRKETTHVAVETSRKLNRDEIASLTEAISRYIVLRSFIVYIRQGVLMSVSVYDRTESDEDKRTGILLDVNSLISQISMHHNVQDLGYSKKAYRTACRLVENSLAAKLAITGRFLVSRLWGAAAIVAGENTARILDTYCTLQEEYSMEVLKLQRDIVQGRIILPRYSDLFPPRSGQSLNTVRAEAGFLKFDCVILTAFRSSSLAETNALANRKLEKDLRRAGMDFIRVSGCFKETGNSKASEEESFLVYDKNGTHPRLFFAKAYCLSEKYGQDCFLYKNAGISRMAFLVSTNALTRKECGNITCAGNLFLDMPKEGAYTELDEGCIRFSTE